ESFRSHYRHVDILLIDDIQFLAGKESTQEEFFHTFNDLYNSKKLIVLSSDRPPRELGDIDERIRSRFAWGFVSDIKPPDYETRIAILKKKAEQRHIPVNDDVINFLAEMMPSNIRELEGALNRVIASSSFSQMPITIENTREWLKDVIDITHHTLSSQRIIELVSSEFGYSPQDICGSGRTSEVSLARQTAMYLCRKHTESSYAKIAQDFGKKDHTTVIHAYKSITVRLGEDERVRKIVENIEKKL
ncbi:MAG: chromosomal replication initiator protein DnaA, partial [Pyramidobacter sp.]|nr:chromosomal replication initiator protein DnaA [Pyramidobacter sp.]